MTENTNPKPFNVSDSLVSRNVTRNVVGSREQLNLQTTLEGGRHGDASDHPMKTVPEDCSRRRAQRQRTSAGRSQ